MFVHKRTPLSLVSHRLTRYFFLGHLLKCYRLVRHLHRLPRRRHRLRLQIARRHYRLYIRLARCRTVRRTL